MAHPSTTELEPPVSTVEHPDILPKATFDVDTGLFTSPAMLEQAMHLRKILKAAGGTLWFGPDSIGYYTHIERQDPESNSIRIVVTPTRSYSANLIDHIALVYYDIAYTADGEVKTITSTIPSLTTDSMLKGEQVAKSMQSYTAAEFTSLPPETYIGLNYILVDIASK